MRRRSRNRRQKKKTRIALVLLTFLILCVAVLSVYAVMRWRTESAMEKPEDLLVQYMNCITEEDYERMYSMLDVETSGYISQENFIKRNSAIYEGIEIHNLKVEITSYDEKYSTVAYHTSFDTLGGNIEFDNEAIFVKKEDGYKLSWRDQLIFPELSSTDKVKISRTPAQRGEVLDCNGHVLADKGVASSVGIVPDKLVDREQSILELAELLDTEPESMENKLKAKWVKDDSFVPIKTIPKVDELALMSPIQDEEVLAEKERQDKLLAIPGVMISDMEIRSYPLGEAASHLVGYVQNVTAEDLENHPNEGYTANSVIGRSGMEGLYEKELKGKDGCSIYIVDMDGREQTVLASIIVENGATIKLTIDIDVQKALYNQFKEDKSCSVAMNPYTGEVLALVSTPSYDNNIFILGMSGEQWTALNEDEKNPLYNRFRQVWSPGSTFKPVIASIGLKTGAINPAEDYGNEGLSWQKDSSWGSYKVTTLHEYEPVTMENALIYSDNIYFAKAALKIGADDLEKSLLNIGFDENIPFEITMADSQFSNTEKIETEIQLADSGYGQGQVLVNPLHLASIYTSFCNNGNIIKPYLSYQEKPKAEVWISEAFASDASSQVLEGLKQVINNPHGTGYSAHMENIVLAGKTGTAEIKASKDDTSGTELGWFTVFTTDPQIENPILIVSMVEDVKEIGGSGYVARKDKAVLDAYLN